MTVEAQRSPGRAAAVLISALGSIAVAGSAPEMVVKPAETLQFGVEYQDQQSSPQMLDTIPDE